MHLFIKMAALWHDKAGMQPLNVSNSDLGSANQCRVDGSDSLYHHTDSTCASWKSDLLAFQSNEIRMWTKAKELLYGYMLIWIFMGLPRLYYTFRNVPVKEYLLRFIKRVRRPRRTAVLDAVRSSGGELKNYSDSGCPVCLATSDELVDLVPVRGECGHSLCVECFAGMWNHGKAVLYPLACPLCTATLQKVTPLSAWNSSREITPRLEQLDRIVRRYNLVFSGRCIGLLPVTTKTVYRTVLDVASCVLRLGYFFVMFDRKVMNTMSFFLMHFLMAVVVEYFETAYLQKLLDLDL